jgi:hypothetical protein
VAKQIDEPNVTREGKHVLVKRARLDGVKADIVKRQLRLTIVVTLDEASLSVRDDLAFWAFDETPIGLVLKPSRTQLDMDELMKDEKEK